MTVFKPDLSSFGSNILILKAMRIVSTEKYGLLMIIKLNPSLTYLVCGPGSSVRIATDYGMDGPGIESRWG
jgi:hypothetical protein